MRRKNKKLTEAEWNKVFTARCKSKQGQPLSEEERDLVDVAYKTNPKRYSALEPAVFNATVPFGSSVRWRK